MSEREYVSPGQPSLIRIAGVLLVVAVPVVFELASGVWPGGAAGEGGHMAAPSSDEQEAAVATLLDVRDTIIAALIAFGGLAAGASGLILLASGYAHRAARMCLKAALIASLLAILAVPILEIRAGPALGPTASAAQSESATFNPGESQ